MEKNENRFVKFLKNVKEKFLDIVFPSKIKCICCGNDVPDFDDCPFCFDCLKTLQFNNGKRCHLCDAPITSEGDTCDACIAVHKDFNRAFAPFVYEPTIRRAILKLKNDDAKYLAPTFAKLISERLNKENISFDLIVPVPTNKRTLRRRGYNQAALIAQDLAQILGVPYRDDLFVRSNEKVTAQKYSNTKERFENAAKIYSVINAKEFKDKNVLIVDDIITTGATVNAMAHLIKKYAHNIYVAAIARQILGDKNDEKVAKKLKKFRKKHKNT